MRTNLKVFRVKHRLSQAEFAEAIGTGRANFGHVERGFRKGSATFWNSMQKTFTLTAEEIEELKMLD